ncbi:MAG: hypothetical protein SAJ12_08120 [Jaaginema sp. PMC 1079.18]|nr:hypothetical protein [Jaaginema sp. PMC 1080.18]MEC4850964.1 hypothetical protein [Jaaginema sp. PMC 1079.18]MEC4866235.1 hypothetical protein [Jaaginema sp. PMC 1078.18]
MTKANQLRNDLIDFIYDAQGEIAIALETYAAENAPTTQGKFDKSLYNLTVDSFATTGKVGDKSTIELYLATVPKLSSSDRALVESWQKSFLGLFEVLKIEQNVALLMNWLTAKTYAVDLAESQDNPNIDRLQSGEIILARIAPFSTTTWMFFGDFVVKGKLGKPKLAVAVGEFKDNYPQALYSDAPDLLEKAWQSVAEYHEEFVNHFKQSRLTTSGYELNKEISELYQEISQKRLEQAGIDRSKSFQEIAAEAGADTEEIKAAALEEGVESSLVEKALSSQSVGEMVTPKVDLPPEIKNAEQVTAFSHPRWGQMFLPSYPKLEHYLTATEPEAIPKAEKLLRQYLDEAKYNAYVWEQLKADYPQLLETRLQSLLQNPEFDIETDFEALMRQHHKPLQPRLPESASVPKHLDTLFKDAIAQVQKTKSKGKKKKKTKGFATL